MSVTSLSTCMHKIFFLLVFCTGSPGGGGGVLQVSSDRDDQMGAKNQNPKTS